MATLTTEQKMNMRATLRAANERARGLNDEELLAAYERLTQKTAPLNNKTAPQKTAPVHEIEETAPQQTAPVPKVVQGLDTQAISQLQQALALLLPQQTAPVVDEQTLISLIKQHATVTHTVKIIPPTIGEVKTLDNAHPKLGLILDCVNARNGDSTRMNVYLYGPAGSGKTTLAYQIAEALDLNFYSQGAILTPYELVGAKDAHSNYVETAFYIAYKKGGVFLQDEIDSCSPRALLCINQALANPTYTFPNGESVKRHADFVYIAGANTIGKGATLEYVGRAQLDAATLDRFYQIEVAYEDNVERVIATKTAAQNGLCPKEHAQAIEQWLNTVQSYRDKASKAGLKVVISPRSTARGVALLAKGYQHQTVFDLVIGPMLSADQKRLLEQ